MEEVFTNYISGQAESRIKAGQSLRFGLTWDGIHIPCRIFNLPGRSDEEDRVYSFKNDYSDGGHPLLLEALTSTVHQMTEGYGEDPYCAQASMLIKEQCSSPDADVHFLSGGTLTNLTAISSFLRPHEAVISAASGHIYVHETGSVEATGHKVFPVDCRDGKIRTEQIRQVASEHHFEHMVKPKLVYISQPTEIGTIYSRKELQDLRKVCDELNIYLYTDGARLGSALTAENNDLDLPDIAALCDAFYIGGTKNGALFGEALLICNPDLKHEFRYLMKQRGAILAKGRLLGIQFKRLFEDGLYLKLSAHANKMAFLLQQGIRDAGYEMLFHSPTNQIFPVFPEDIVEALERKHQFYRWETLEDGRVVIRLVCSWATEKEGVERFLSDITQ